MDLLEFDHTLRTQGLEAALRALFIILQNLMTTVEELHKLQAPAEVGRGMADPRPSGTGGD